MDFPGFTLNLHALTGVFVEGLTVDFDGTKHRGQLVLGAEETGDSLHKPGEEVSRNRLLIGDIALLVVAGGAFAELNFGTIDFGFQRQKLEEARGRTYGNN